MHVGLAHHYARMGARQGGVLIGSDEVGGGFRVIQDERELLEPEEAMAEWCRRHPEGEQYRLQLSKVLRAYQAHYLYEEKTIRVLEVEREHRAHIGTLDCPGHPRHGQPILYTARVDLVTADKGTIGYAEPWGVAEGVVLWDHKCLPVDAVVETRRGQRAVGSTIFDRESRVASHAEGQLKWAEAKARVPSGTQPVHQLCLSNGRKARLGATHPVLTPNGWVLAKNLTKGTKVACPLELPQVDSIYEDMPDSLIAVVALFLCDGSFRRGTLTKTSALTRQYYIDSLLDLGFEPQQILERFPKNKAPYVDIGPAGAKRLVDATGTVEVNSPERGFPPGFRDLSFRQSGILIGALWSGDGAASVIEEKHRRKIRIVYSCCSRQLVEDIQYVLLHRLGIPCTFTESTVPYKGERRPVWTATVVGDYGKRRFLELVLSDVIYTPYLKAGEGLTRAGNPRPTAAALLEQHEFNIRAKQGCKGGGAKADKVEPPIWWIRVTSNVYAGDEPVYDIEVPETHNFVAEGLITHNTTSAPLGAASKYYSRHGQFLMLPHLGRLAYGDRYERRGLNMVQITGEGRFERPQLEPATWAIRCFPEKVRRMEHRIAALELSTSERALSAWEWPTADNETVCYHRYGACDGWDLCQEGRWALRR